MKIRFNPHTTERRALRMAYGSKTSTGLVSNWSGSYVGDDYVGQLRFAKQAVELLGVGSIATLHESGCELFSEEMTHKSILKFCRRVAANFELLVAGRPVLSWGGISDNVVAPLQIVHIKSGWSRGKKPVLGVSIKFRVIDGEACAVEFRRWFPIKFLFVFAKELGIGNYRTKHHYSGGPNELYGMRFVATLVNSEYERGAVTFERYAGGQFISYNRKLIALRGEPCPLGYSWECHACSYGEDECPAAKPISRACRPLTLCVQSCEMCGRDTQHDGEECMRCRKRRPNVVKR